MTASNRTRWWLLAIVLAAPAVAVAVHGLGWERADQVAGVLGLFVGLAGTGVSVYSARLARGGRQPDDPPAATGGLIVATAGRRRRTPAGSKSLVLHHWMPVRPEHWASPAQPSSVVGGHIRTLSDVEPGGSRYSRAATAVCGVCHHAFEYRRLSDPTIRAMTAARERRRRITRRLRWFGVAYLTALAVGSGLAAGLGYGVALGMLAAAMLATACRPARPGSPIDPHVILAQSGYPRHTARETDTAREPSADRGTVLGQEG